MTFKTCCVWVTQNWTADVNILDRFSMMPFKAEPAAINLIVSNTRIFFFCSPASDTEQDAAVKLEKERAEIVAKYDKVRVLTSGWTVVYVKLW